MSPIVHAKRLHFDTEIPDHVTMSLSPQQHVLIYPVFLGDIGYHTTMAYCDIIHIIYIYPIKFKVRYQRISYDVRFY